MVAGHLQEKNGIYYVVLTYKTYDGKRKTKWQSTGLPIKGNKRRAEAMMRELQDDFEPPVDPNGPPSKAMLFADYLVQWLEIAKSTVKLTTYASYKELSNSRIIPYFRNLGVTLGDLKAVHIQAFYQEQLERVKPNTVIHYHAVIHRALKYAVKTDLIDVNPADKVDRPKKNEFTGNFYSKDEMNALFDAVRGSKIEVAVMLTAFYGLRRSEVVGLKWAAVDFEQNTLEICHTVTTVRLDGKEVLVESNDTKTKSSKRTLPLVPVFRERLLALQEEQKENRKLCGRCYNKKIRRLHLRRRNGQSAQAGLSLQFVPDYLAKLSSAAHPLSRFAPLLRQFAFGKRRPDEDDSGVAGTQRFLYHREYLFAFGLRFQGFFGRSDAERAWNGFKSGK